jgi:LysM repeat protein
VTRKQMAFLIVVNGVISTLITLLLVLVILPALDLQPSIVEQPTTVALASPGPQATSAAEPVAIATPLVHTVRPGDTISGLALEYDVPAEDIIAANQLKNPDFLQAGARLVIPVGGVLPATPTLTAVPTDTSTPLPFDPPSVAMTATAEAAARPTSSLPEGTGSPGPVTGELAVKISEVIGAGQTEQERVVITNLGERLADMQGWKLSDGQGKVYTFPNVRLWPSGNVTVHSREGDDGSPVNNFYWKSSVAIWSPGKVVTLTDAAGNVVSTYTVQP